MKVGIYNPYLHAFGGGENEVCVIADILSKNHDIDIIATEIVSKESLESRFNVNLKKANIIPVVQNNHIARIFQKSVRMKTIMKLLSDYQAFRFTKKYDVFINLTVSIPIPSFAKDSILIIQFPFQKLENPNIQHRARHNIVATLYEILKGRLSPSNLDCYKRIFCHSTYTKNWVETIWKVSAQVLYPPVEMFDSREKKNCILSVGRFFVGGHSKKHLEMINCYKEIFHEGYTNWEYHLAGSSYPQEAYQQYLMQIEKEIVGYPIYLHTNAAFSELKRLYGESKIFWHATGFGEDRENHPERFEHFGLTTAEAMSAGCIPITFNGGGQPEIVEHGVNGFLWNTIEELREYTIELMKNESKRREMKDNACERSRVFSRKRFEEEITKIIEKR